MKLGTSGFARRGQWVVCFFSTWFTIAGISVAQEPSNPSPAEQSPTVATPAGQSSQPAAQPSGQPNQPASQPANQPAQPPAVQQEPGNSPAAAMKPEDSAKANPEDSSPIKLGVGDLIEVAVYNVPELTTKARISNAGDVYLPLVDYVHVEGMTQEEAQALIEKRLLDGGFVRSPHVSIFVDDAASQGITVLGEVMRPGIYPDVGDHKLFEILSQAGGFTQNAARKVSILRRNDPNAIHVDLPRNLADDPAGNVTIVPGDTVTVPRAPIIYIVGDVARPSGLLIDNGTLTVLQALALAGGTNHTAKLSGARIIRKGPTGMTETKVEIKKMLEAKIPDLTLNPDDILFIPVSGAKVLAGKSLDAAISAATAVGIYASHP